MGALGATGPYLEKGELMLALLSMLLGTSSICVGLLIFRRTRGTPLEANATWRATLVLLFGLAMFLGGAAVGCSVIMDLNAPPLEQQLGPLPVQGHRGPHGPPESPGPG